MEIKITIGKIYISGNKPGRMFAPNLNSRMHWGERGRWTHEFKRQAWVLASSEKNRLKLKTFKKAKITILFYACRQKDLDNAYGSAKPLVDGIVATGIIPDDSDKYLDLKVQSIKVSHLADQKTEITIKEIKKK